MAWIRLDDQIPHHPKFTRAGPISSWLWLCCVTYSSNFLTDGVIPKDMISTLCGCIKRPLRHIEKLVQVGLLDVVEGGWQVHDYLDFNESRAEAQERKKHLHTVRSDAGKAGNKVRWQTDRNLRKPVIAPSRPVPSYKEISNTSNKLVHKGGGSSNTGNGNGGGGKKERPQFTNGRFAVHRWQVEELISMLGPHVETFDLDEWLLTGAEERAQLEVAVIPDWWPWLRAETLHEAQRRGLPIAEPTSAPAKPHLSKQSKQLFAAIKNLKG